MKLLCVKIALVGTLLLSVFASAYSPSASKEAIGRIATPDNMGKDELIQTLVGTWQCAYRNNDVAYDAKLIFADNGKLTSQKTAWTLVEPKGQTIIHTNRDWQVVEDSKMWLLVETVTDTTHFDVPSAIENTVQLKNYLDGKPTESSLMSFDIKDGKQTLTRIESGWGLLLGECVKEGAI